jgi:hypothetical protein
VQYCLPGLTLSIVATGGRRWVSNAVNTRRHSAESLNPPLSTRCSPFKGPSPKWGGGGGVLAGTSAHQISTASAPPEQFGVLGPAAACGKAQTESPLHVLRLNNFRLSYWVVQCLVIKGLISPSHLLRLLAITQKDDNFLTLKSSKVMMTRY